MPLSSSAPAALAPIAPGYRNRVQPFPCLTAAFQDALTCLLCLSFFSAFPCCFCVINAFPSHLIWCKDPCKAGRPSVLPIPVKGGPITSHFASWPRRQIPAPALGVLLAALPAWPAPTNCHLPCWECAAPGHMGSPLLGWVCAWGGHCLSPGFSARAEAQPAINAERSTSPCSPLR